MTTISWLRKSINRAVRDFNLIEDGDRIAVGVSGGKDSRALLDLLLRGVDIPGQYTVTAVHVDGSAVGLPPLAAILEPWFQTLGVPYTIAPLVVSQDERLPMDCFRCSWNRRKALFLSAEAMGCNKVAYGHHADDATATTLLSLLYKGRLETLTPRLSFFDGRITIIRPLIYLTAAELARHARDRGWTFPPELECPRRDASRRVRLERFLTTFSHKEQKQFRVNLWRAANSPTEKE
ncbi:MAG: tRNA 2-thiocytidine(32) synthetase TtcA [Anaerolineae bacterium]|nr:tRNA 2-thiocytidine(32) synthetase TtcA [Anaerolineae bacterium]